ncbi:MAG: hypothetical protein QM604_00900 [Microbacterium sp.]
MPKVSVSVPDALYAEIRRPPGRGPGGVRHVIVLDASALVDVLIDQPNKPAVLPRLGQRIAASSPPREVLLAAPDTV